MEKILEFLKKNVLIVKWTIWYVFVFWLITRFVFNFNMFSKLYWWKFFHATFHGFWGLTFVILVYSAIPIYIATTLTIHRKQALLFKIPLISNLPIISKLFEKKVEPAKEEKPAEEPEEEETKDDDSSKEEDAGSLLSDREDKGDVSLVADVSSSEDGKDFNEDSTELSYDEVGEIDIEPESSFEEMLLIVDKDVESPKDVFASSCLLMVSSTAPTTAIETPPTTETVAIP